MSALLGEATGFLDKYLISGALSSASGDALRPVLQDLVNAAWSENPVVPPPAVLLAEGVAQGQVSKAAAYAWAKQTGFGKDQMDALVNIANVGPALGYAFEAWRRGFLTDAQFQTALTRTGLEPQWFKAMEALKTNLPDLATIANGIQRGLISTKLQLPYDPTPGPGKIPPFPITNLDAHATAQGLGYTDEELALEVGLAGNPPGPEALFRAMFRGAIVHNDVLRGLVEGRARAEWAPAFEADAREILTPAQAIDNTLRGYSDQTTMLARTDKHGMSHEDATALFQNAGRPLAIHQITTGLARGGQFHPEPGEITDPFEAAVHESDIKPAYYELAVANKYTYPSAFVLRALTQAGDITVAQAEEVLLYEGWEPTFAKQVAASWAPGGAGKASTWVTRAQGYLFTAVHKAFQDTPEYEAKARAAMSLIGIDTADQSTVLELFRSENTL